jgi:cytochrome P450
MIVAGNETTRQALSLGTLALCEQPEQYDRLRADRSLIPSAVDELLRHRAPVWFFRRTTTRDVTVRGVDIPAGDKVVVWFAAANRDPDKYPDPHRVDVGRDAHDHLTFGRGGPHHCLGVHLAKLELKVYLEELVERVARVELAGSPSASGRTSRTASSACPSGSRSGEPAGRRGSSASSARRGR